MPSQKSLNNTTNIKCNYKSTPATRSHATQEPKVRLGKKDKLAAKKQKKKQKTQAKNTGETMGDHSGADD
jgi:hypothetical protein